LTVTHFDIACAVHIVFQFLHATCIIHLHAVKRIFKYLQGTKDHGLLFRPSRSPSIVVAYSVDDYASYKDFCRSTVGYEVHSAWHSKKQSTVSKSSTEAEYCALGYTVA